VGWAADVWREDHSPPEDVVHGVGGAVTAVSIECQLACQRRAARTRTPSFQRYFLGAALPDALARCSLSVFASCGIFHR
jgi:hypothetical protein